MRNLTAAICLLFSACGWNPAQSSVSIEETARTYFEVYAQRSDFERFMNFYASDAVVRDIIYGNEVAGKDDIRKFFDWERGGFKVVTPGPILEVETQVVSGRTVITRGAFKQFEYDGNRMGPWKFLIWQRFDDTGQVIYQEDWINYTPKKILIGG